MPFPTGIQCPRCNRETSERHCAKASGCCWFDCSLCQHRTVLVQRTRGFKVSWGIQRVVRLTKLDAA